MQPASHKILLPLRYIALCLIMGYSSVCAGMQTNNDIATVTYHETTSRPSVSEITNLLHQFARGDTELTIDWSSIFQPQLILDRTYTLRSGTQQLPPYLRSYSSTADGSLLPTVADHCSAPDLFGCYVKHFQCTDRARRVYQNVSPFFPDTWEKSFVIDATLTALNQAASEALQNNTLLHMTSIPGSFVGQVLVPTADRNNYEFMRILFIFERFIDEAGLKHTKLRYIAPLYAGSYTQWLEWILEVYAQADDLLKKRLTTSARQLETLALQGLKQKQALQTLQACCTKAIAHGLNNVESLGKALTRLKQVLAEPASARPEDILAAINALHGPLGSQLAGPGGRTSPKARLEDAGAHELLHAVVAAKTCLKKGNKAIK